VVTTTCSRRSEDGGQDQLSLERSSLMLSSDKIFSAWAETFGDPVAVAAMVDRLVHHAEVIVSKGGSYRLKGKGKGPGLRIDPLRVSSFQPADPVQISTGVDIGILLYVGADAWLTRDEDMKMMRRSGHAAAAGMSMSMPIDRAEASRGSHCCGAV